MKDIWFLFLGFFIVFSLNSQSIRKNFREMTDTEKINLVNAFYQLRTGQDLINELAEFHRINFNSDNSPAPEKLDIHINLPDEPEREIFFAWYRRYILELEHAMQEINPNISIPFVDWGIDNSPDSPLWDKNFMGQFDEDWLLNRNLGAIGQLPTNENTQSIQGFTSDFFIYSNNLERSVVHSGPHLWIEGEMSGRASPRDPVFYLHHAFLDKLWNDWEEANGKSQFLRTDMIRYDGTNVINGDALPLVNPNDILKSNHLGVFYAEDKLAILHNYEIANTFKSIENFYYQYTIEIGNNFKVPRGKNCKVESVSEIILKPGFNAEAGSSFLVKIDASIFLKSSIEDNKSIVRNQIRFEKLDDFELDAYSLEKEKTEKNLNIIYYPNPFKDKITIRSRKELLYAQVYIYDLLGNELYANNYNQINTFEIRSLNKLNNGIYFLVIKDQNQVILNAKLIKQ